MIAFVYWRWGGGGGRGTRRWTGGGLQTFVSDIITSAGGGFCLHAYSPYVVSWFRGTPSDQHHSIHPLICTLL